MIIKNFIANILFILFFLYSNASFSQNEGNQTIESTSLSHNNYTPLIAVVPQSFPPFYYMDKEGLPYGMAIEVLNEIDHSAGFRAHYVVKKSWVDVFKAIDSGEAQIIPNLGITEERRKKYFFSKPYAKTEVTVFTRPDNRIKSAAELNSLHVGVVKKNVGLKIAKEIELINRHEYESIKLAFNALISKKIDAIIYPKIITNISAEKFHIQHLIYDNDIILKTIHRALAVSKKYPEIFKKLNVAFEQYSQTQEFIDTYAAWIGANENTLEVLDLIIINVLVLFVTLMLFNYLWRKKKLSIFSKAKYNQINFVWIAKLIAILIIVTTIVASSTLWILYETSFSQERLRLVDVVKSRARLIEAIVRNEVNNGKENNKSLSYWENETLDQIVNAHRNFKGFGKTGEFTLARKNNGLIDFVLRQRHSFLDKPDPIPFDSMLAAPMRLALLGYSGTIIGNDYRGENVLAAYEPVGIIDLGIVAKIDIYEIQKPFIRSALYILLIVVLVSLLGSLIIFYTIIPIINKIKETEQRFHQLFINNYTPVILVDAKNARIIDANNAAIKYYRYTLDEIVSYNLNVLSPAPVFSVLKELYEVKINKSKSVITQHRLQNGDIRDVEILMSLVQLDKEKIIYCVILDITEKLQKEKKYKRLHKDLEQARKMEALGQLTGGIAHDFNNMLGIIMGYTEIARDNLPNSGDGKVSGYLDQVLVASTRAKELISSMMLFSRRNEGDYQTINISSLVTEDIKMLRSIIPTSIEIKSSVAENLPAILIEPIKLQQLIMNLCVNARDAMDEEGILTIKLDFLKDLNDFCPVCNEKIEGDWLCLSVTDTGSGIPDDVVEHLFEPFFTTKEQGKGTGMGMAVVHGIVMDLKAHILIDTTIGKGTTISILFNPVSVIDESIDKKVVLTIEDKKHNGEILIVDDEKSLSELLGEMLTVEGYDCQCFSSSTKALAEFEKNPHKYDLIISDQTMPGLTGFDMIKKIRERRADMPAIIATGFSSSFDDTIAKENNIGILKKPASRESLLKIVNKVLDEII